MKKKQKQHYTGKKWIAALVVIVLIFAAIYYYIALPAINIHNPELWKFVLFVLVIAFALYALPKTTFTGDRRHPVNFSGNYKTTFGRSYRYHCCRLLCWHTFIFSTY